MRPQEFMDQIVLPTVLELKNKPRSRRRAYLACIVTFHIKDHLKVAGETNIEHKVRQASGDAFDVVRAVCNGTKHVQTNSSHPIQFEVGTDWDRPPAIADVMVCDLSRVGDSCGGREIRKESQSLDLYFAITKLLRDFCASYPDLLGSTDLSEL